MSSMYRTQLNFKTEGQEQFLIRIASNGSDRLKPSEVIKKAIENHGKRIAVAWSGGRCSTVMLHMALKINPNIKVFFVNTGVEFPEIVRYVNTISKAWKVNLTTVKPERTFWEIVEESGFPKHRRPGDGSTKKKSGDVPPCCWALKKKPVKKYVEEQGVEAVIDGVRAGESRVRALIIRQKGAQYYFVKSEGFWKFHPLAFWSTREVSDYVVQNQVELCPIYSKTDRTGCWPCTAFVGWQKNLMSVNPKMYEKLNSMFTEKKLLQHYYNSRLKSCGS